jgi:hypothetical protein
MPTIDWQAAALTRGLELNTNEATRIGNAMTALDASYYAMAANLTHEVEPSTTIAEEAVETR